MNRHEEKRTLKTRNVILSGMSLSPGLSMGRAYIFHDIFERDTVARNIELDQVDEEFSRIEQAVEDVGAELRLSAERIEEELESAMADIFRAHEEMLRDVTLVHEVRAELEKELVNAEHALQRVFRRWELKFRNMDSDIFKQRGDDIVDLGRRLLRSLAGIHAHSLEKMPIGSILVARKLFPSDTVFFSRRSAAGIVIELGGPGSHCALLTRQIGIPGICQIPNLLDHLSEGELVLVDGEKGSITISPDEPALQAFEERIQRNKQRASIWHAHGGEPAVTRDGATVAVMANIGNQQDVKQAVENGADGVGLYRIEVLFLARKMLPTEDDLVATFVNVIAPLKGKPLYIRLLDIGGDKQLSYLQLPAEMNPFLGRRGVRLLLHYPELLNVQLRALLRLSQTYEIHIIVPMVTVAEDMKQVRRALNQTAADIGITKIPRLGAMIETPAAALCADEIANVSDFFSIGTNDLTQYTMAAGRENPLVYHYFQDDHPAVIKLLRIIQKKAGGIPVGLCGVLASRREAVPLLLNAGIRMLSIPPPLIPSVKEAVRNAQVNTILKKKR
jgi:phosphoenolpyruvate-protein phosphotransferase